MIGNATFYKIGIVVPDLDATAARLNSVVDMDWREIGIGEPYEYWFEDGVRALKLRAIVSGTKPHVHLFEEQLGTIWESNAGTIHHVAYWVDDIEDATRQMLDAGFKVESRDTGDPEMPQHWAYFVDSSGVRVELLDRFGSSDPTARIATLPAWKNTEM